MRETLPETWSLGGEAEEFQDNFGKYKLNIPKTFLLISLEPNIPHCIQNRGDDNLLIRCDSSIFSDLCSEQLNKTFGRV